MISRLVPILVLLAMLGCAPPSAEASPFGRKAATRGEYIIVSGGPALRRWEAIREDVEPHDLWWGNFIRAARYRMAELIKADPAVDITWLVYRHGYLARGAEEGVSRIDDIRSVPEMFARDLKHPIRLVWFDQTSELIAYINDRSRGKKIAGLEIFAHSNSHAFMFDYSNHILGASQAWLHVNDLDQLHRKAFDRNAYCKSWGCSSGQYFSKAFRKATGVGMWGATDKTEYSVLKDGQLPVVIAPGRWVRP